MSADPRLRLVPADEDPPGGHRHEHVHAHGHALGHHGTGHGHAEPRPASSVEVQHLHFRYPDGFEALKGVDLSIDAGEKVALVGPNGAGKSTLLLHLNGIHEPSHGTVRIGDDLTASDYRGYYELDVSESERQQSMWVDKPGYESYRQDVTLEGVDEMIQDVDLNPDLPPVDGGSEQQGR